MTTDTILSAALLISILIGCVSMTRGAPPAVALSLVALVGLALAGGNAEGVVASGFGHFAEVAFAFTAVGVPAHRIAAGGGFARVARRAAYRLGLSTLEQPTWRRNWIVIGCLFGTWALAAVAHNSTAIWTMVRLTLEVCAAFRIRARWILCGELVASNLGGFSTSWGDTPNIIESAAWGLTARDFLFEILPANVLILLLLVGLVLLLTRRDSSIDTDPVRSAEDVHKLAKDADAQSVDWPQVLINAVILVAYLAAHIMFPAARLELAAIAIGLSVVLAPGRDRLEALGALGFEVYVSFAAVFVLAGCVASSPVGAWLAAMISTTGADTWVVLLVSYFGTMLTEAASWAAAAAPLVHAADPAHRSAWALGAGICAGSSSLLTAASAGIILAAETKRYGDANSRVGFGEYLLFGLGFSAVMLVAYAGWLTYRFGGAS